MKWVKFDRISWTHCGLACLVASRGRLNIKMSSYQYRDSHVKDKTVSRPSYLLHGNPHTLERRSLYWDRAQIMWCQRSGSSFIQGPGYNCNDLLPVWGQPLPWPNADSLPIYWAIGTRLLKEKKVIKIFCTFITFFSFFFSPDTFFRKRMYILSSKPMSQMHHTWFKLLRLMGNTTARIVVF